MMPGATRARRESERGAHDLSRATRRARGRRRDGGERAPRTPGHRAGVCVRDPPGCGGGQAGARLSTARNANVSGRRARPARARANWARAGAHGAPTHVVVMLRMIGTVFGGRRARSLVAASPQRAVFVQRPGRPISARRSLITTSPSTEGGRSGPCGSPVTLSGAVRPRERRGVLAPAIVRHGRFRGQSSRAKRSRQKKFTFNINLLPAQE